MQKEWFTVQNGYGMSVIRIELKRGQVLENFLPFD